MSDTVTDIDQLIERWEDLRDHGEPITVDELCRDCPQLAESVRRKIAALLAFESFNAADAATLASAAPATPPLPPSINGYEILDVLGRGGMGVVYKARQPRIGRIVALKMILAAEHASVELRYRFRREAEAVVRVRHPGIVQIYEVGASPSGDYLAMEFVEGGSLADRLDGTPWKAPDAAQLVAQLADAMQAAHEAAIIHRDLKPANVLLTVGSGQWAVGSQKEDRDSEKSNLNPEDAHFRLPTAHCPLPTPKITDFGIAKRLDDENAPTASGAILGTPSYMAPEQADGRLRDIGPATDVYALGAILYELLSGRPPFKAATAIDTIRQVIDDEPVPLSRLNSKAPRDLETITLKCLRKDPMRRYDSARGLAADLRRYLNGEPILARPVGALERALKWARRRPTAAALIGVSTLALTVLIAGGIWYNARLAHALDDKDKALDREKGLTTELREELGRSERLFREGDQLTRWLLNEHLTRLAKLRGGTPAQKELVGRLLVYLDRLAEQMVKHQNLPGDVTAADVVIAYERLGDVQKLFGDRKEALTSYDKALALRDRILAGKPENIETRYGYANCLLKKGAIFAGMEDTQKARTAFNDALSRMNELAAKSPDDPVPQLGQLQARAELAYLDWTPDPESAIKQYQTILQEALGLLGDKPRDRNGVDFLIMLHRFTGMLLVNRNDGVDFAQAHFEKGLGLVDGFLERSPDDALMQTHRNQLLLALADLLSNKGLHKEALGQYQKILESRRKFLRDDPNNPILIHQLGIALERVASELTDLKEFEAALPILDELLAMRRKLVDARPDEIEFRRSLGIAHINMVDALLELGKLADAEKHAVQAQQIAQELIEKRKSDIDWGGVGHACKLLADIENAKCRKAVAAGAKNSQLIAYCRQSGEYARAAVAAFDRLAKVAPLDALQISLRAAAHKLAALADARVEQFMKFKD